MKVQTAVYCAVGVVAALVVLTMVSVWIGKKFPSPRYDERQKIARGNAYRFAFWIGIACYMSTLIILTWGIGGEIPMEPYLMLFICLAIQTLAFHVYCFMTRSAMPFGEKPVSAIFSYASLGLLQFFNFFRRDVKEVLPLRGVGAYAWINLFMGIFFLSLAVMYVISLLIREKE